MQRVEREDEINFESFMYSKEDYNTEVQHGGEGTARLESCELVDSEDVPEGLWRKINSNADKYLKFRASLTNTDKKIIVYQAATDKSRDLERILEFTDAEDIRGLAGKRAPIRHMRNNYYTFEPFNGGYGPSFGYLSMEVVKTMIDNNLLMFREGKWITKEPVEFALSLFLPFSFGTIAYLLSAFSTSSVLMVIAPVIMAYILVSPFSLIPTKK